MTHERFKKEVSEIETLDPTNIFLSSLKRAHTVASEAYLEAAWKMVAGIPVSERTTPSVLPEKLPNAPPSRPKRTDDETLNGLFRRKGHIGREMRRVRLELHTADTQNDRANIMADLDSRQAELADLSHQVRYYEEFGKLPKPKMSITTDISAETVDNDEDLTLLSDMDLVAALAVASSSLSRVLREIGKIDPSVMDDMKNPRHDFWRKKEKQRSMWERRKLRLTKEKNQRKNEVTEK